MGMTTMERSAATERVQGTFTDNLIPERVFNAELRRVDSTLASIGKTIERVEAEIKNVRTEIKDVRAEIKDVRTEIKDVRAELKADIKDLRDDNKADNKATNARIDRVEALLWGILSTVVISIIAQIVIRYI
ncbi:hypothetical protein AGMMS50276_20720 [Synergistales bacterium]|nr:hypothetical protein AGMMS50276_20720 [Synergistales bacterium]